MSILKKLCTISLSAVMLAAAVGCAPKIRENEEEVDATMTQLYVANYDGGVGTEWLYDVEKRFEAEFAETSFEPGKKGVQVWVDANKTTYQGQSLISQISTLAQDIFFSEEINYYDYVSSGKLLDITDIMTEDLTEYGESRSIEDKMNDTQRSFLKNTDGKYYAIPHFEVYGGIIYDVDLFENEGLYFALEQNNGNQGFVLDKNDTRAAGPDGELGTYDDGLPATYDDFFRLCERMRLMGITPISWAGQYRSMQTSFLYCALHADYEGERNMLLNYNFSGTADNIVTSIGEDGQVTTKQVDISPENGYELMGQAGRYYALKFFEELIAGQYYSTLSFNDTQSHTAAQEDFIKGNNEGAPIGMLLDGTWWENEATISGAFESAETDYGQSAGKEARRFGFMPYPKATEEQIGDPLILVDKNYSYGFINANISESKVTAAKTFLHYCYTDESMQEFTKETGLAKGLDYTLDEDTLSDMTYYQQQLWQFRSTATVLTPCANSDIFKNNMSTLRYQISWEATVGNTPYNIPVNAMRNDGITALQYFEGMAISAEDWAAEYSRFF